MTAMRKLGLETQRPPSVASPQPKQWAASDVETAYPPLRPSGAVHMIQRQGQLSAVEHDVREMAVAIRGHVIAVLANADRVGQRGTDFKSPVPTRPRTLRASFWDSQQCPTPATNRPVLPLIP